MPEQKQYILGYDPGGNGDHGVALMEVEKRGDRFEPIGLPVFKTCKTVSDVIRSVETELKDGTLVATGIDTLTAWSHSWSGRRPADASLQERYKGVAASVDSPNHINGAMAINGALVLHWLNARKDKGGVVTEAHPKVCFFALWDGKARHPWASQLTPPPAELLESKKWLLGQLHLSDALLPNFGAQDHTFDALLSCLAAWKGLNKDWTADLHKLRGDIVHPFFATHYWWPEAIPPVSPKGKSSISVDDILADIELKGEQG